MNPKTNKLLTSILSLTMMLSMTTAVSAEENDTEAYLYSPKAINANFPDASAESARFRQRRFPAGLLRSGFPVRIFLQYSRHE